MFSDEGADMKNAKVISLRDIFNLDSSLIEINIERGEKLYRDNVDTSWQKI